MMSVKDTLKLALKLGLVVERGTKHYKIKTKSGERVAVVPFTSNRDRGRQGSNALAAIRKAGQNGSSPKA